MSAGLILIIFSALAFAFGGRTDALPVGVTPADAQSAMLAASLFRYGALLVCAVTAFLWRRRLRDELDAVRKRPNGELERWLLSAFCVVFFFSFVVVFANRALVAAASNAEASSALLPLAELAALWLGVIAVLWGLGLFAVRFVTAGAAAHGLPFWWGLFAVTVFLQLWHLAAPISLVTLLVVAGGGIAGLVVNRRAVVQSVRENAWLLAAVSSLGLWIANRALAAPRLPDFGLYHVPMMRWTQAYAIVPGLGNLHGRLAFNNSSLLYAALVDKAPGNGSGWLAFGGPMLLVFAGASLAAAVRVLTTRSSARAEDLLLGLLFPVSLVWSSGAFVASPHPDVPLFPLGVLSAALVLSMLRGDERLRTSLTGLTMLVALGISIKLSFAAFGLTALAIGIVATWKRLNTPERIRALIAPALLAFAIGGPWIARGYILSGYPAYPSTVLRSSADWRVPEELAAREVAVIRAMARDGKRPWQEVARDPHWMSVWFPRTVRRVFELTLPLGLFVLGLIVFFAARRHGGDARRMLWVLAPPGVALVAWFFMAPDPRFAGASFWILGAGATALAITALNEKFTRRAALAALVLALVIFALDYPNQGTHRGPHSLPQPEIAQTALTDGTAVTVPPDGLCWDGPLLCTPEADPGLRLRKSGDISAGFQITRAF